MHCVYVLISEKDHQLYIGYAEGDLKARIEKHRKGFVKATKNRLPVKLIYYEAYLFSEDAKRREKYLKGGKGRGELKVQIRKALEEYNYKHL